MEYSQANKQTQQIQSTQPHRGSFREGTPQTRISKAGKIPDPIRGMLSHERFSISEILKLPLTMKVGDKSDVARRELALSMQRSTPRYRVKKVSTDGSSATDFDTLF